MIACIYPRMSTMFWTFWCYSTRRLGAPCARILLSFYISPCIPYNHSYIFKSIGFTTDFLLESVRLVNATSGNGLRLVALFAAFPSDREFKIQFNGG